MSDTPPFNEWSPGFKASDIPVTPGDEPNPLEDPTAPAELPPENFDADYVEIDADEVAKIPADSKPASDLDSRKLTITFIKDETGAAMRRADMTLPELAAHIAGRTAADKMDLPWLKLALFGTKRSDKNSLRTNANTLQITGVEGDHDSGELSFEEAVARIRQAKIRALLYTSASYVPGKERWRILVPLSQSREPEVREKFVARLNGLLDGKLAPESFTLSQGYLYGHLNGAECRVEVLDGDFIDRRDDLYRHSIFKGGSGVGDQAGDVASLNGSGGRQHGSRVNMIRNRSFSARSSSRSAFSAAIAHMRNGSRSPLGFTTSAVNPALSCLTSGRPRPPGKPVTARRNIPRPSAGSAGAARAR